jgi:malonyl-CoA/methylmalonyl-CoA synthetase
MAVPTIYARLIGHYESELNRLPSNKREEHVQFIKSSLGRFRLMVSGSAALSPIHFDAWKRISGSALLERYGMTEIGQVLYYKDNSSHSSPCTFDD